MKRVILDSDYGPDVDDLIAHAILHALADLGECEILAEIVCTNNPESPGAMNAVDTWHGRPNIPVGGFSGTIGHTGEPLFPAGGGDGETSGGPFSVDIYNADSTYPRTVTTSNYPDALEVYRQALHDAPDSSVTIITIGMLNTLAELLNSPSDSIDSRNGADLIAAKVTEVYIMGGAEESAPNPEEFNMRNARQEASNVADNLPVPIIWSQWEIGATVITGTWEGSEQEGHIVRFGMEAFDLNGTAEGQGRESWDAMNVLLAIRGTVAGFSLEQGEMDVDAGDGGNTWTVDAEGPHFRASKTLSDSDYEETLEPLVFTQQGGNPQETVYWSSWSDVVDSAGEADFWSAWSEWVSSVGPDEADVPIPINLQTINVTATSFRATWDAG